MYPQAATVTYTGAAPAGPPMPQDPMSAVLGQALQQYEDVEQRLKGLRDRLQVGPGERLGKEQIAVSPQGLVSTSNGLRNLSSRLQSLCSELETML